MPEMIAGPAYRPAPAEVQNNGLAKEHEHGAHYEIRHYQLWILGAGSRFGKVGTRVCLRCGAKGLAIDRDPYGKRCIGMSREGGQTGTPTRWDGSAYPACVPGEPCTAGTPNGDDGAERTGYSAECPLCCREVGWPADALAAQAVRPLHEAGHPAGARLVRRDGSWVVVRATN